jgi:hypothetical protein
MLHYALVAGRKRLGLLWSDLGELLNQHRCPSAKQFRHALIRACRDLYVDDTVGSHLLSLLDHGRNDLVDFSKLLLPVHEAYNLK